VKNGGHILIMPGELIHGITREKVTLPPNLAALIEGRSSLARVGLLTHLSSGFVHPGSSNHTVLEIANISPMPLAIQPGTKICQLILTEVIGEAKYSGRFANQLRP
jgi:dCTP deaminase